MPYYAITAQTTAFQSARQASTPRLRGWLTHWLDAHRAKAAERRLTEQLLAMDSRQLADIGIEQSGFSDATRRLAAINPYVFCLSLPYSARRG
jgi:uncharacterized protein YjiS (DUF1127 family)